MIRLHIVTEGETERQFVKQILTCHLADFGIYIVSRCALSSRDNRTNYEYRGGSLNYQQVKNDIENWMKEDSNSECRFSTMFDLYGLSHDFPGFQEAGKLEPYNLTIFLSTQLIFYYNQNGKR